MKGLFSVVLLLASAGVLPAAMANSNCDRPRNDFDGLYCLNKVYQQADVDLNTAFKAVNAKLDAKGKVTLKRGQLEWMKRRNDECSMRREDAFYVDLECATDTTIGRTQFLQNRLRECVSSGCRNSKLSSS